MTLSLLYPSAADLWLITLHRSPIPSYCSNIASTSLIADCGKSDALRLDLPAGEESHHIQRDSIVDRFHFKTSAVLIKK
jgi:hypothetical protein